MNIRKSDEEDKLPILSTLCKSKTKDYMKELKDKGIIEFKEGKELPEVNLQRTSYNKNELCAVLLLYICYDFRYSNAQLSKELGVDRWTIGKIRNSPEFKKMYSDRMNELLSVAHGEAIQTLRRILKDPKSSNKNLIDASQTILRHTSDVAEILRKTDKHEDVDVDELLKAIEEA
ncbi:hypothetical protein LN736_06285 [Clostridium sp. WLY-B-L2]|uniref:Uncharacterized protein n=1 Tax=Clostridium aromativorans TaxID=2836848 RepID=A0ABS8N3Y6_9CLOT|nr:hypothetical protein [Clostridium aromativorans]MCC9294465.1 hypothetical protein [Clostridium aromativorans]